MGFVSWKKGIGRGGLGIIFIAIFLSSIKAKAEADPGSLYDLGLADLMNIEVETASRRTQSLISAPANIMVITAEQIQDRHYVNLNDLLNDLPSVEVFRNAYAEFNSLISIRGNPGNNKFVILVNGLRTSSITGEPSIVEENYPLFRAKKVEIIFGPASALYGADAFSGIINIITQDTEEDFRGKVSASYGTHDYNYEYAAVGGTLTENLKFDLGFHRHNANNTDLAKAYPDHFALRPQRTTTGALAGTTRTDQYSNKSRSHSLEARIRLDKKLIFGFDQRNSSHSTAIGALPEHVTYGDQEWDLQSRQFYMTYKTPLSSRVESETQFQYQNVELLPDTSFNNSYSGHRKVYKYMNNQAMRFLEQLSVNLSQKHHWITGFQYDIIHSAPKSADLPGRINRKIPPANQGMNYPTDSTLPVKFYELNYRNVGVYTQFQSDWASLFSSTLGVRYDYDSRFGDTVNPRLGGIFKFSPDSSLKLLYGESFLAPSSYHMYQHFGSFNSGTTSSFFFHLPNPHLRPEKARTWEFNYSLNVLPLFPLRVSGYYSRVKNIIFNRFHSTTTTFAGGTVLSWESAENMGHADLYGGDFQLAFETQTGPVQISPWVNYTYSWGKVNDGLGHDLTLPYNSRHKVKGGLTLKFRRLTLTPEVQAIDKGIHRVAGATQSTEVAGFMIWDLVFRADDVLTKGLFLLLEARNLLDKKYYRPGEDGSVTFSASPQDPRKIFLEAGYLF